MGNTEGARESYAKALRIREVLASSDPSDQQVRRGMSESYTRLGQLSWTGGDPAGSAVAAANPNDPNSKFAFAAGTMEYGFMLAASGKIQEGLEIIKGSLPLFESVAASEDATNRFKDGLATAYERVATVLAIGTPNKEEALTYYAKSLEIREALLAANPQNADFIRGVAASHGNIGETQRKVGDLAGAIASHKKSLQGLDEVAAADPRNDQLRQDTAFIRSCYAEALAANGEGDRALEEATRAREAIEPLLAADPTSVLVRFRFALSHESLGNAHATLGSDTSRPVKQRKQHLLEARGWFESALKVYRELRDNGTMTGDDAAKVEETEAKLARCNSELGKSK
jgi:tetratricopeptide (TPR) repeat protein